MSEDDIFTAIGYEDLDFDVECSRCHSTRVVRAVKGWRCLDCGFRWTAEKQD